MTAELNGWSVQALTDAVDAVRQQPAAGKLTWRSRVRWDSGFGLDVHTLAIHQLKEVMKRSFTLRGDHPPELLGQNTGPTAIETLLAALGSCMAGTFAAQATARGVILRALEVDVEAAIDLNGFFGILPTPPGISDVKLLFHVEADASSEMLQEILDAAKSLSPVFDSVTRPKPVDAGLVVGPEPSETAATIVRAA